MTADIPRKVKFLKMCSNPECSPMLPLTGTVLERKYWDDKTSYRCSSCKSVYCAETLGTDICPRCDKKMKHPKMWYLKCPKCGRNA